MVWSDPDTRKATVKYLGICLTTQPLYQGAGKPEKRGQKSHLLSGATNLSLVECKVCGFDSQEDSLLFTSSRSW